MSFFLPSVLSTPLLVCPTVANGDAPFLLTSIGKTNKPVLLNHAAVGWVISIVDMFEYLPCIEDMWRWLILSLSRDMFDNS